MDTSARRRSGWVSLCLTLIARMLLGILASLLLWAVAPAALGWHPTVVMTGSMLPRLVPGDVVLSRPVPAEQLQLGQTLLYADPDRPGHLRMHRWVDVSAAGLLVTKGDANPERDSTPITRSAVEGVASLRIPFVARPVVWANEGRTAPLLVTGLALLATVVAAGWFRAADEDDRDATDDDPAGDDPGDDAADDSPDAGVDAAADRAPGSAWPRRLAQSGAALLVVLGLAATHAATADAAPFSKTTANAANSWTAAQYFSCGGAARTTGARFSWPLGETSGPTAQDATVNNLDGTYGGGVTYGAAGPCRTDGTTGVTLNGSSGAITSSVTADSAAVSFQVWVKAAPASRGGTVLSFTDGGFLGLFPSTSFAVGMGTSGGLTFAFNQSGAKLVISSATDLRDNAWHQVTAVAGSGGMALFVDGAQVASNSGVPVTTNGIAGTARVGYGVATSLGTSSSNYFTGSVAFATFWRSALTADTVAATYRAAT